MSTGKYFELNCLTSCVVTHTHARQKLKKKEMLKCLSISQERIPTKHVRLELNKNTFSSQVRFLVEQGIDHLVSLSPEKIPPHYAFPDLQHTLIPVEDFTGPTIAEIQKFLEICDCARRDGEVILNTDSVSLS